MPIYQSKNDIVLVTIGDPSGIGPEIVVKSLLSHQIKPYTGRILVIGDAFILNQYFKKNKACFCLHHESLRPSTLHSDKINVLAINALSDKDFSAGLCHGKYGAASLKYIDAAVRLLKNGYSKKIVTAPVSKEAINMAGIPFSGHTEYFAKNFKVINFGMMFYGEKLKTALVTRHIPIRHIARQLHKDKIYNTIKLFFNTLQFMGIKKPKIAVCGLNPHCRELKGFGKEERFEIIPAIKQARRQFKSIYGPISADSAFFDALHGSYDGIVCMYHDQGLPAVKMLERDSTVNITMGLPIFRASVSHGTAFDIAGKNIASINPFVYALKTTLSLRLNETK